MNWTASGGSPDEGEDENEAITLGPSARARLSRPPERHLPASDGRGSTADNTRWISCAGVSDGYRARISAIAPLTIAVLNEVPLLLP